MANVDTAPLSVEPKRIFRILEPSYADLPAGPTPDFFGRALERTRERFGLDCAIENHALFQREGSDWIPISGDGLRLIPALGEITREERSALHTAGTVLRARPFHSAVWLLGSRREFAAVLRFAVAPGERTELILKMAHMAIQQHAQQADWTNMLDRAKAIQRSLLPDPFPGLAGFDIAARSDAAEDVGGDVFDGIPLASDALGVMIADASGHGLPAALEARDVVIGLRMGTARHLKISTTLERLNRILCRSTLSSRFVSLVYGELETDGTFDYVNAGHPAPLILSGGSTQSLPESGPVLGVLAGSRFRVGHGRIPPGGTLLLYTDGVTECPSPGGEEFGIGRLTGIASLFGEAPAAVVCSTLFDALERHAGGVSLPDDASIVVIRRAES